jgi:lipid-A-disaccharide synthase
MLVAGEASGDLHAAGVASEMRRRAPELHLAGIGGERMAAAGVELLERSERLAVMGFVEVLRHVPQHWALLRRLRQRLRSGRVSLLVLVDYPGFNMKLAAEASRAGVPVLYYITPQVWAWGAGRLAKMARTVTRAAVILPFEQELLASHGVRATFVGHPLLDRARELPSRDNARRSLGLPLDRPVLALFPGSRTQEIARHLDAFVGAARELERRIPNLHVVVSVAPGLTIDRARCPYPTITSASFSVLRAATAALCKSGTSTLEAAVADCPLIVAYRTSGWTYAIARRVVTIPRIGLVNVVADREVAPEFVQDAVVPGAMADALEPLLDDASDRRRIMRAGLAEVRSRLGSPGAAGRVAEIALSLARGASAVAPAAAAVP